jgi:Zn-dependent protease with chaperone function
MDNLFRTGVLLAALTALFLAVGYAIGGSGGMLIALTIAVATNLFAYWNADSMVLAAYGARPIAGAELSGNPQSLASALRKIEATASGTAIADAERNPATAHPFIINPLHAAGLARLFATHPATEERVRRPEAMAAARGIGALRHWSTGRRGPWGGQRTA